MKTIITAAIIATATLTATVSNAGTYSYCTSFSGLIEVVAEARSEAAAERYHDSIKTMTRLLEDKREDKPRKRFLGIF